MADDDASTIGFHNDAILRASCPPNPIPDKVTAHPYYACRDAQQQRQRRQDRKEAAAHLLNDTIIGVQIEDSYQTTIAIDFS